VIGLSFPHGGEDGNEGDLHDHDSMWADTLQMVHHEGGKEGCPYDHGVHGHEESSTVPAMRSWADAKDTAAPWGEWLW